MRRAPIASALVAAVLIAAGCGDSEDTPSTEAESTTSNTTAATAAEPQSERDNVNEDFGFLPPDIEVDVRVGTQPAIAGGSDPTGASEAAGCEYSPDLPDEGNTHFTDPSEEPDYETSPPTSGDHFFSPQESGAGALADGAFLDQPPDNRVVHSLEHGRVAIQYSPDLSEEDQLALKGLFDADRPGVLLFPNADIPGDVSVTAWTAMIGCDAFDGETTIDAIAAFRDEYRGQGPEPVAF